MPLLAAHRLDLRPVRRRRPDPPALRRRPPRDAARDRRLRPAALQRRGPSRGGRAAPAPGRRVALPRLGAAAYAASKRGARGFWRSLTTVRRRRPPDDADRRRDARRPRRPGPRRRRPDVEQIHAPQAWAAGYDGTGTDRRRARHRLRPDASRPRGRCRRPPTSPSERPRRRRQRPRHARRLDHRRHGRRLAAASHGGVAPGAHLLVGKVLDDTRLRRGLVGARRHGVGGRPGRRHRQHEPRRRRPSDGTDPLEPGRRRALGASSDTLFVIAAGNTGARRHRHRAGRRRRGADRRRGRRRRRDGLVLEPRPAPRRRRASSPTSSRRASASSPPGPPARPRQPGRRVLHVARAAPRWRRRTSPASPRSSSSAHPGWDGEQLKAAIIGSTVAVRRRDRLRRRHRPRRRAAAIAQTVVAGPSLDSASTRGRRPAWRRASTPLTYTNLGAAPVTFALSLASEDGSRRRPAGVSLGADP